MLIDKLKTIVDDNFAGTTLEDVTLFTEEANYLFYLEGLVDVADLLNELRYFNVFKEDLKQILLYIIRRGRARLDIPDEYAKEFTQNMKNADEIHYSAKYIKTISDPNNSGVHLKIAMVLPQKEKV